MRLELVIIALTLVFHVLFVSAVVIPFGWDALNPLLEVVIVAASVSVAMVVIRLKTRPTWRKR